MLWVCFDPQIPGRLEMEKEGETKEGVGGKGVSKERRGGGQTANERQRWEKKDDEKDRNGWARRGFGRSVSFEGCRCCEVTRGVETTQLTCCSDITSLYGLRTALAVQPPAKAKTSRPGYRS